MKFAFNHYNINVSNLQRSMEFYAEAFGLREVGRIENQSFTIVYLGDEATDFRLELTCLNDHPQPYDLGECEFHLALQTDDYDAAFLKHNEMNCVCCINEEMGIYFVSDPDGYWIEVIPQK